MTEFLCPCGYLAHAAPPVHYCAACGRVWKYEITAYANDWRCISGPRRPEPVQLVDGVVRPAPLRLAVRLPVRLAVFIEEGQLITARESAGAWMRTDDVIAALQAAGIEVAP